MFSPMLGCVSGVMIGASARRSILTEVPSAAITEALTNPNAMYSAARPPDRAHGAGSA